jgi:cation:H+ antiporter
MVRTAVLLADRWGVSKAIVGVVLLAVLTSLPNAFTAIRLALAGRGEATVSDTMGSNTINLLGGLLIPALFIGVAGKSGLAKLDATWLAGMTALVLLLLARGIGRRGAALLVVVYGVFVAVQLLYD